MTGNWTVKATVIRGRKWRVTAAWLGWWRVWTVGGALNVAAPAVDVWLFGWKVSAGRVLVVVETECGGFRWHQADAASD